MILFSIQKSKVETYSVHIEAYSDKKTTGVIRYSNTFDDLNLAIWDGRDVLLMAITKFGLQGDDIYIYTNVRNPDNGEDKIPASQIDDFVPTILSFFN